MMLLFSDVCECAPDLRGRSHVGHTFKLEVVFSVLHLPVAFPNKRLFWSSSKEGPRVYNVYLVLGIYVFLSTIVE